MCSTGIYVSLKRREGMEKSWLRIKLRPHKGDPCWLQAGPDRKLQAVGLFCLSGPLSLECPAKFLFGSRSRKEALSVFVI